MKNIQFNKALMARLFRQKKYQKLDKTDLLRKQEVGEDLHPSVRVNVGVELHQGLVLVVGQPDGGDALHLDE